MILNGTDGLRGLIAYSSMYNLDNGTKVIRVFNPRYSIFQCWWHLFLHPSPLFLSMKITIQITQISSVNVVNALEKTTTTTTTTTKTTTKTNTIGKSNQIKHKRCHPKKSRSQNKPIWCGGITKHKLHFWHRYKTSQDRYKIDKPELSEQLWIHTRAHTTTTHFPILLSPMSRASKINRWLFVVVVSVTQHDIAKPHDANKNQIRRKYVFMVFMSWVA